MSQFEFDEEQTEIRLSLPDSSQSGWSMEHLNTPEVKLTCCVLCSTVILSG